MLRILQTLAAAQVTRGTARTMTAGHPWANQRSQFERRITAPIWPALSALVG